jgi:hypothetical protein
MPTGHLLSAALFCLSGVVSLAETDDHRPCVVLPGTADHGSDHVKAPERSQEQAAVQHRAADDRSAAWGPPVELAGGHSLFKAIAAAGTSVHVARGEGVVLYRRSDDEGRTWSPEKAVAEGTLYLSQPMVAEGHSIYLVYFRDIVTRNDLQAARSVGNIYFRRSDDNGESWSEEFLLGGGQGAFRISLAASGQYVHAAWMDYRSGKSWDIYYRRSADRGRTWSPEIRLIAGLEPIGARRPSLAAHGADVYLTWMDGRDGERPCTIEFGKVLPRCTEIYFKRSMDDGERWGEDVRLTRSRRYAGRPAVVVSPDGSRVAISFDGALSPRGQVEQFLMASSDGGRRWTPPRRISGGRGGESTHGTLLLTNRAAHLAWFDTRFGHNSEIYYAAVEGDGPVREERATSAPGASVTPLLGITRSRVHSVWTDQRHGGRQALFYASRALEGGF